MPALRRTLHWLTVLFPLCDLEGNEWEEHPKYELTGEGNSVATKGASTMYSPWHDWASTLVTNRVMDSGIHRISLIYTVRAKIPNAAGLAARAVTRGRLAAPVE